MSFKRQPEMNSISNTTSFGDSMERSLVALQLLELFQIQIKRILRLVKQVEIGGEVKDLKLEAWQ